MNRKRLGIASLLLLVALVMGVFVMGVPAQTEQPRKPQVGIGLETNRTTEEYIAGKVRIQLRSRGVAFKEQDVQAAAQDALDLVSKSKDPLKGVIYIKTKKFTICLSWGRDKEFCKSH